MGEDASLEDFLDAGDREAELGESDDGPDRDDDSAAAPADDDQDDATDPAAASGATEAAVEPATTTLDWTPAGAACEACGEVVERRWRDDAGLVCEHCKDW